MSVVERCSFTVASADDLGVFGDGSVDALTTRSVLIYVKHKAAAFREFHRVLKPGGRLSIWEPINSFNARSEAAGGPADARAGGGVEEIADLARRLHAFFQGLQPDDDPMMDFDERDLLRLCEEAGFGDVRLNLTIRVSPAKPMRWETAMNASGNPNIPSLGEAMAQIFTDDERARYERYARPRVEAGGGAERSATALLSATKAAAPEGA